MIAKIDLVLTPSKQIAIEKRGPKRSAINAIQVRPNP